MSTAKSVSQNKNTKHPQKQQKQQNAGKKYNQHRDIFKNMVSFMVLNIAKELISNS